MNALIRSSITAEDVEDFRKEMRKQRQNNSPAKAKKRLIEAGLLTKNGKPRWPGAHGMTRKSGSKKK